jgi:hypothetical protein
MEHETPDDLVTVDLISFLRQTAGLLAEFDTRLAVIEQRLGAAENIPNQIVVELATSITALSQRVDGHDVMVKQIAGNVREMTVMVRDRLAGNRKPPTGPKN